MFRRLLAALFAAVLPVLVAAQTPETDYETLFDMLAEARSESEAQALSTFIWRHWLTAPDADAQALLDEALAYRTGGDYTAAIAPLDALIEGWPDYAEGWNQRATIYFLLGDLDHSLADVDEVLAREPRHFGALSGQAIIYLMLDEEDRARAALTEALRYHPFLAERSLMPEPGGTDL